MERRTDGPVRAASSRGHPQHRLDRADDACRLHRPPRVRAGKLACNRLPARSHRGARGRALACRADLRRPHLGGPVRKLRQGGHLPGRRGRDHRRPWLVRARYRARVGICSADPVQRSRHERDGLGDQPHYALCRARAAQPRQLRARRLPPHGRAIGGGGPQIFRARRARERDPALRHLPALRLHRDDQLLRRRGSLRTRRADARASVRPRFPARRTRLQDKCRAVPHVDSGRLRRRADAGDHLLRLGPEGRGGAAVGARLRQRARARDRRLAPDRHLRGWRRSSWERSPPTARTTSSGCWPIPRSTMSVSR